MAGQKTQTFDCDFVLAFDLKHPQSKAFKEHNVCTTPFDMPMRTKVPVVYSASRAVCFAFTAVCCCRPPWAPLTAALTQLTTWSYPTNRPPGFMSSSICSSAGFCIGKTQHRMRDCLRTVNYLSSGAVASVLPRSRVWFNPTNGANIHFYRPKLLYRRHPTRQEPCIAFEAAVHLTLTG